MSATFCGNSIQLKALRVATALLVLTVALGLGPLAPVHASPVAYTLYGTAQGWGFTAGSITSPGPDLTAAPGESVEVTLYSADGVRHNFYVDYNGNGFPDPDEPLSADFGGRFPSPITYAFTATMTPGTYAYICDYHASKQFGRFIVGTPPTPTAKADLVRRSAWPELHHFVISRDADGFQSFFGKVRNLGTVDTVVRVDFDVHDATGAHIDTVSTGTMLLAPGQMTEPPLSGNWVPVLGKFMVEARAWFDSDGNGTPDTAGAKIKTFSFAVVA